MLALVAEEMINSYNNLLLSSHEITSVPEKTVYKQIQKSKFAIPSSSKNILSVKFLNIYYLSYHRDISEKWM